FGGMVDIVQPHANNLWWIAHRWQAPHGVERHHGQLAHTLGGLFQGGATLAYERIQRTRIARRGLGTAVPQTSGRIQHDPAFAAAGHKTGNPHWRHSSLTVGATIPG